MVYVVCKTCFEGQCTHWKCVTTSHPLVYDDITIQCTCQDSNPVTQQIITHICDTTFLHSCPHCNNQLIYSMRNITSKCAFSYFGKYPTSKCEECKGSGCVVFPTFKKCNNCEGTGGTMCLKCRGSGNIINNHPRTGNLSIIPCGCDNGYTNKCYNCMGCKAIVGQIIQHDCKSCT
jgi:hypothetical protein